MRLEIPEYTELFHLQGYKTGNDIENLKDLKDDDLRVIGISKRGKTFNLHAKMKRMLLLFSELIFRD